MDGEKSKFQNLERLKRLKLVIFCEKSPGLGLAGPPGSFKKSPFSVLYYTEKKWELYRVIYMVGKL